jgi:alpha-1,3-glucosyltransferase
MIMVLFGFGLAAVYRTLVGLHSFSGQGDHHGHKAAYGGDFEAQRHWMEITYHLPIGEWYWYDLQYWGLDYPPLTAYFSYLAGAISHYSVGPETVALYTSRGYEQHKSFMRLTVLLTDLAIYGTAVWAWIRRRGDSGGSTTMMTAFVLPMLHPAIVLIDHGHFQYNTTALGLSLWSFYYLTKNHDHNSSNNRHYYIAALLFCLALNYKQMTLYYAPAVFAYLLGDCCGRRSIRAVLQQFAILGAIVMTIFTILWWPFVLYGGPDGTTNMERLFHVLRRIFPLQRGLFEGKVANLWCAASVRPIRIRDRLSASVQPLAALLLTLVAILPSSVRLFQLGYQIQRQKDQNQQSSSSSSLLLWGMTSCALAFFLASFQVHEKSILMALAPASLLLGSRTTVDRDKDNDASQQQSFLRWLALFSTWTLWPLLTVDRLQTAYCCTMVVFVVALTLTDDLLLLQQQLRGGTSSSQVTKSSDGNMIWQWSRRGFLLLAVLLHGLELVVIPPKSLPDLFPVLWSVVGCAGLSLAYLYTIWQLFIGCGRRHRCSTDDATTTQQQRPQSKAKTQ